MGLPAFESSGLLPLGRYACDLDEVEAVFVTAQTFQQSSTRKQAFGDLMTALALLERIAPGIVMHMWLGGGFVSAKLDPSDIDVTFILNPERHDALGLEAQERLVALLSHGGFKSLGLSVDGFMMVHRPVANPWTSDGGVRSNAAGYLSKRGAWDDWWGRHRVHGSAEERPKIEDAVPRRGYVEVTLNA